MEARAGCLPGWCKVPAVAPAAAAAQQRLSHLQWAGVRPGPAMYAALLGLKAARDGPIVHRL